MVGGVIPKPTLDLKIEFQAYLKPCCCEIQKIQKEKKNSTVSYYELSWKEVQCK